VTDARTFAGTACELEATEAVRSRPLTYLVHGRKIRANDKEVVTAIETLPVSDAQTTPIRIAVLNKRGER
jgi:hypothetical protein